MTRKYYILISKDDVYDRLYLSWTGAYTRIKIDKDAGWEMLELTLEDLQRLKRMKDSDR